MKVLPATRGKGVIMDGGRIPHGGGRIADTYQAHHHGSKDAFHRVEYQGMLLTCSGTVPFNWLWFFWEVLKILNNYGRN